MTSSASTDAGPLKRRLAALICIVHLTGCTAGGVHTAGCRPTTGCKHRVTKPLSQLNNN